MDEEQTLLQTLIIDTNNARQNTNTIEAREHLNLKRVRMVPPHFCP